MENDTGNTVQPVEQQAELPVEALKVENEVVNASGKIDQITAQTVVMKDGSVGKMNGESVTLTLENGGVGAVIATTAQVEVTNGGIGAVIAQNATVKGSTVNVVIAGQVTGDAHIMFDMRAGLLAGIATGLVLAAFRIILSRRAK